MSNHTDITRRGVARRPGIAAIGHFPLEHREITCPCGTKFSGMYAPNRVWCPGCENLSDQQKRAIKAGRKL
ncbi:MAG: hypothetical protein LLG20_18755 [Acidobacteriales bacterium]|nr:hypothetical protein [Terriglobales bacterium]